MHPDMPTFHFYERGSDAVILNPTSYDGCGVHMGFPQVMRFEALAVVQPNRA
jgi:hypothetical protein